MQKSDLGYILKICLKNFISGGNIKIKSRRSDFTGVKSKCGTLDNIHHKPAGGDVEIFDEKLEFEGKFQFLSFLTNDDVIKSGFLDSEKITIMVAFSRNMASLT